MAITLLGTSHIATESASKAQELVSSGKYGIIAIELDRQRLQHVMSGSQEKTPFWKLVRVVGLWGALFAQLGRWIEHKLGARVGMLPGAEMKAAVIAAAKHNKKVALIDQPIHVTLRRFNQAFTWRERWNLFKTLFRRTEVKRFDLRKAPSEKVVKEMLAVFEQASPGLAKVLIHERNAFMTRHLLGLQKKYPEEEILAVVGAGHVPGMKELLDKAASINTTDKQDAA